VILYFWFNLINIPFFPVLQARFMPVKKRKENLPRSEQPDQETIAKDFFMNPEYKGARNQIDKSMP